MNAFPAHLVTLEEADPDGRPQQRACYCAIGRNHFFDEEPVPAEKSNEAADLMVPRYRDDVTICLYTRFGREHARHIYSYIYPEANGAGWYDCTGLDASEAGHPYPKRPTVRTGMLVDDLVDDLVGWWHVYGTSEVWLGDQLLPMALDAAARQFVVHAQQQIEQQLKERWKDRVEQIQGEPEKQLKPQLPFPRPIAREFYRYPNGRLARVWPVRSMMPNVPEGFVVCALVNGTPRPPHFTYALDAPFPESKSWAWFKSTAQGDYDPTESYTWDELNGSTVDSITLNPGNTSLVEVLSGRARRWQRGEPEPDMPQGFEVARRVGSGFHRFVRMDGIDGIGRWVAKDGGDWYVWEDLWYGPGGDEVIEVMPEVRS